jgi:hypothetical protein
MALALYEIAPSRVLSDGGCRLDLKGEFDLGTGYFVHVGLTGTTADEKCLSGKAGQGKVIYPVGPTRMRCWTPRLPVGGPLTILVINIATSMGAVLTDSLRAMAPDFQSAVFSLRSTFPPIYITGARKIDDVPDVQGV